MLSRLATSAALAAAIVLAPLTAAAARLDPLSVGPNPGVVADFAGIVATPLPAPPGIPGIAPLVTFFDPVSGTTGTITDPLGTPLIDLALLDGAGVFLGGFEGSLLDTGEDAGIVDALFAISNPAGIFVGRDRVLLSGSGPFAVIGAALTNIFGPPVPGIFTLQITLDTTPPPVAPIPLPAGGVLLLAGALSLGVLRRRT